MSWQGWEDRAAAEARRRAARRRACRRAAGWALAWFALVNLTAGWGAGTGRALGWFAAAAVTCLALAAALRWLW